MKLFARIYMPKSGLLYTNASLLRLVEIHFLIPYLNSAMEFLSELKVCTWDWYNNCTYMLEYEKPLGR